MGSTLGTMSLGACAGGLGVAVVDGAYTAAQRGILDDWAKGVGVGVAGGAITAVLVDDIYDSVENMINND